MFLRHLLYNYVHFYSPALVIRSLSFGINGLWSSVATKTDPCLDMTARESPKLAKNMWLGRINAQTAVVPLRSFSPQVKSFFRLLEEQKNYHLEELKEKSIKSTYVCWKGFGIKIRYTKITIFGTVLRKECIVFRMIDLNFPPEFSPRSSFSTTTLVRPRLKRDVRRPHLTVRRRPCRRRQSSNRLQNRYRRMTSDTRASVAVENAEERGFAENFGHRGAYD
uniref:Uncharacterized protein n=1 Tax=Romanomermis culicivorax TaxID=13658 RepID=A0A915JJQ3_ROMCU